MNDIFVRENIYPHEGKFKEHFKDFYNAVFVAFLPFFKVDRAVSGITNFQKSELISYQELQKKVDAFKDVPSFQAKIFSHSNKDYPSDEEIYQLGTVITWKEVIEGAGLKNFSELNRALRTSIGALLPAFARPDLIEKLNAYTFSQKVWLPTEGNFTILAKMAIYKTFKMFGKNQIIVTEESYLKTSILDLDKLTDFEFSKKVDFKDYYIYSSDKEILFTVEWDSFFFLIAADDSIINAIIAKQLFEGFPCDDDTVHEWEYEKEEIKRILENMEQQSLMERDQLKKKKQWRFWRKKNEN